MSIKHMSDVWQYSKAEGSALLLLLALADYATQDGICKYAISTLAARCRRSPKQTRRLLQELESLGEIAPAPRPGTSTEYKITLDPSHAREGGTPIHGRGPLPRAGGNPEEEEEDIDINSSSSSSPAAEIEILLRAAGVTGDEINRILDTPATLQDVMAVIAFCHDPKVKVRRPEIIIPRNLLARNYPSRVYYNPETQGRLIPDDILDIIRAEAPEEEEEEETEEVQEDLPVPPSVMADQSVTEPLPCGKTPLVIWETLKAIAQIESPRAWQYLQNTVPIQYHNGALIVETPTTLDAAWLRDRYTHYANRQLPGIANQDIKVQFQARA